MITTEYLANFIETRLNQNSFGKNFLVFADEGDMRNAKRCCKQYQYWTNCLLEVVSSTVTPIKNISFETATVQLMFIVDLAETGQTKVGAQNREQSRNLLDVKKCIYEFIGGLNGVTTSAEVEDKTYTLTIGFGQPTDGQKTQLGEVSEALPLYLNMTFSFFENGVNANDCHVYVNGEDLYFTRCVVSKVRTADQSEFADAIGNKAYMLAGGKSVDLVIPVVNTDVGEEIMEDIFEGDNNVALDVEVHTPLYTKHFIGTFGNNAVNMDAGANLGYNVSIVEGKDNILSYSSDWVLQNVTTNSVIVNVALGGNSESDSEEDDDEEVPPPKVPIYWGDGSVEIAETGNNSHTYADEKDNHTIRIFNKDGVIITFPSENPVT